MGTYTTVNSSVNNSISLASKFLPILDEVYKTSSRTSILDTLDGRVNFIGANAVNLFKTSMDGLGNYSRNSGYVTGDVTGTWETKTLEKDRGRSFLIDAMDNDETLGLAMGTTLGEFVRTKVVPEIDAYRFAKYASTTGISTATAVDLTSSVDGVGLIDTATKTMNDDEVPVEGRILFVSEAMYKNIKEHVTRYVANDDRGINRSFETFDGMRVIRVPSNRFNTAITLYDGTTSGQTAGGYIPTAGGYAINFMIIHPSAVLQVVKHQVPRIFSPDQNIEADGYRINYRIYHDAFVEDNKVAGIYLNAAATANT